VWGLPQSVDLFSRQSHFAQGKPITAEADLPTAY